MLEALLLAAGASTRFGSPKAVLPLPDGRLFVTRLVDTLLASGLDRVTVVTGPHHDVIAAACAGFVARGVACVVRNEDPARGQISSLLTGLDAVDGPSTQGALVALVDVPLVAESTVQRLIEAWLRTRAPIVRPVHGSSHGHPVIFDRQVFPALRQAPLDQGAKAVIRAWLPQIENVPVDDFGCLIDIDTPLDYEKLVVR